MQPCLPCMQLYLHKTYLNYTTWGTDYYFACVTLPERYSGVCMGVQHSCPDLLLMEGIPHACAPSLYQCYSYHAISISYITSARDVSGLKHEARVV